MNEVCDSFANPAAHQREITALQAAMKESCLSEATLVIREESEQIMQKMGILKLFPLSR